MKLLLRFLGFLFAAGTIVFVVGVAAAAGLLWHFSKDLPDYSQLQDYEPPVMTRVHAIGWRGRTARQQNRIGSSSHAHPNQYRGEVSE